MVCYHLWVRSRYFDKKYTVIESPHLNFVNFLNLFIKQLLLKFYPKVMEGPMYSHYKYFAFQLNTDLAPVSCDTMNNEFVFYF